MEIIRKDFHPSGFQSAVAILTGEEIRREIRQASRSGEQAILSTLQKGGRVNIPQRDGGRVEFSRKGGEN